MKANVLNIDAEKISEIDLPKQFYEEIRPDLIHRAVLVIQSQARQQYGSYPEAGKEYSAKLSRRRRDYKTSYGHGISRVPRKTLWHRGRQFGWVGAFAPGTVGGRRAHPPKASKIFAQKINKKEKRKAIRSAIAATIDKNLLIKKGFSCLDNIPIIFEDKFENISKTKELTNLFKKIGIEKEIERTKIKKIRAGKGKLRGRKYRTKKGPLIVVSKKCPLFKALNYKGFDVCTVKSLNAELLAPGTDPGRLVIWSLPAIQILEKEKLFM